MEDPSLQTIPKPASFQRLLSPESQPASAGGGAVGSAGSAGGRREVTEVCNIRAAFVAERGRVMLSADYAQVEFRLMAHFSGGLRAM
jgi:DNA polymerase theta